MGIRITERRPYSTVSRPKYVQKFRTKSGNFGFCAEFFAHRARNSIISDETGFSLPKKDRITKIKFSATKSPPKISYNKRHF